MSCSHLVHMCWPLLWGLHQMGCCFATFCTYALVGSLKWIMRALNSHVVVASPKSLGSLDITPPHNPQPIVVANVNRKDYLQSALDAFL